MSRYIDADKLHYSRIRIIHEDGTIGGWNAVVMSLEIKDAPTADVEEVRHGKWVVCGTFDDFLKCSECGVKYPAESAVEFKGCPICRAKMDKEKEE